MLQGGLYSESAPFGALLSVSYKAFRRDIGNVTIEISIFKTDHDYAVLSSEMVINNKQFYQQRGIYYYCLRTVYSV